MGENHLSFVKKVVTIEFKLELAIKNSNFLT